MDVIDDNELVFSITLYYSSFYQLFILNIIDKQT